MDEGPPPPPPPHGENPHTTEGEYRKSSDLPPGNYDIFIVPPHSSGGGFLYLPSLQCHRNSFLAGVASTLLVVFVWALIAPMVKTWYMASVSNGAGGVGMAVVGLGLGVAGWAFGMTQSSSSKGDGGNNGNGNGNGGGSGGGRFGGGFPGGTGQNANGRASGHGHSNSGSNFGGNSSGHRQQHSGNFGGGQNYGNQYAGNQHGSDGPPKDDGKEDEKAKEKERQRQKEREREEKEKAERAKEKAEREREREEAKRKEELRRKMEEFKRKREAEAKEKERRREREAMEKELKERREQLEREMAAARDKAEKEARERLEKEAAEARAKQEKAAAEAKAEADRLAAEAKEKADRLAAEAKEKAAKEAAEKEAAAKAAAQKEAMAKFAALKEAAAKRYAEKKAQEAKSQASNKPPASPASATSAPRTPSPKKPQAPFPTAKTTVEDDAYSFRPYDRPRRPYGNASGSGSAYSESSYAPSQSTARTTPPPSHRSAYSTKDPDKIVIQGVYQFNNAFMKTPVAQLVSGQGMVTNGLVLRMTTEGLFVDDDLRGVGQREWDVKAWTLKLAEVWCPQMGAHSQPAKSGSSNPFSFRRGASAHSMPTNEESDAFTANLLKVCKNTCRLASPSACFARSAAASGGGPVQPPQAEFRGLHVLRASIRDQEGKKFVFVLQDTEAWKLAIGLQRLRGGALVRALGVSALPVPECKSILGGLGYI
ncbi:hypothetical protein N7532_010515 [Penicillium argentinense]|uniref:Uncharacterized protein n=1 Tax=Penicillium argentinense TaxID=1131581 RepID=A0A9W9EPX4_9EURO|nr:uncharacterized protein N7532_010515 [Penicillium argentinense]KAJ5085744.1 hypothetical protein N7532_010515 [Penicillium argentinense]